FSSELRGDDRVPAGEAAGRVGEHIDTGGVKDIENGTARVRVEAPQRDRADLCSGRLERPGQDVVVDEPAGAEDEPRAQLAIADAERLHPPCTAETTSTVAPSGSTVASQRPRGTTSPPTATAT